MSAIRAVGLSDAAVRDLVRKALEEDVGDADVTSRALVGPRDIARAVIVAKDAYILAGGPVARQVFASCDRKLSVHLLVKDGARVASGVPVLHVRGRARSILAAERVALNFLQRMTGIATLTDQYVRRARPYGVKILDTRKTTPGLRILEKYAVRCGGGVNHRMGLYDRILIKDNHRAFWKRQRRGELAEAVVAARRKYPKLLIEVEVESEADLRSVLREEPDWVLLDNMNETRIRRCVQIGSGQCKFEASGGITLKNVGRIARAGVDAISVGALTHSAPAADFSLEFTE